MKEEKRMLFDTNERPPFGKNLAFALQQFLTIIAATMLVPVVVKGMNELGGIYLSQSAALIGAGVGTLVYLLLSKFKSPVFLGSSFTFINPLATAVTFGYFGVILGAIFASLVYVILALIVKFAGTDWINKLMPPVVIGPTVALIGFDLASSAINNLMNITETDASGYNIISILVGVITFLFVVFISVKGPKGFRIFPFICGVLFGYVLAVIITLIGIWANVPIMQLVDFTPFTTIGDFSNWLPNITFIGAIQEGFSHLTSFSDVLTIFVAFVPVSLVAFSEHIADHKNISYIIGKDLFKDPGLHRTLFGDGLGSLTGAMFGGCPNTTYGESIGCVALSRNASTFTIFTTSIICIIVAFFYPVIAFVESIPGCVIGGICVSLYGFISVSGLRMLKDLNLNETKNVYIISSIFICGIGGLYIQIGSFKLASVACALIVGILTNLILKEKKQQE